MRRSDHVLILGSAPDVLRARAWPRDGFDRIVAINNAWAVRPDWDHLVHPSDFPPERLPPAPQLGQTLHGFADYVPAVNGYGGFVYAGGTMAFTAAYWALRGLQPRLIAFLGCDMVYDGSGASHFYGRGRADPLRPDPTLQSLEAKSARFAICAAEAGCAVVNLSDRPTSRLIFPRVSRTAVARWSADDSRRLCAEPTSASARALAARARTREAELGYVVPDGKYWKQIARLDAAALRGVDALWLAAARSYSEAA